jgi:hypothetical protein
VALTDPAYCRITRKGACVCRVERYKGNARTATGCSGSGLTASVSRTDNNYIILHHRRPIADDDHLFHVEPLRYLPMQN